MGFFKKWGALLFSVGATVATAISPTLSTAVGNHKMLSAILASALYFLHAALPSVFGDSTPAPAK